jgi:hypothetical protein
MLFDDAELQKFEKEIGMKYCELELLWGVLPNRSKIDKSLTQLFYFISCDPKHHLVLERGLLQREILYFFKSYTPKKNREKYNWLDKLRKEFKRHGGRMCTFSGKNGRQILDNHLRRMVKMKSLRKIPTGIYGRYTVGTCFLSNPGAIQTIKSTVEKARLEECWSNHGISIVEPYAVGVKTHITDRQGQETLRILNPILDDLLDVFQPPGVSEWQARPLIVIDPNRIFNRGSLAKSWEIKIDYKT